MLISASQQSSVGVGRVLARAGELPRDRAIISYCRSGARNIVATQALRRAGLTVVELDGSYQGWEQAM